MIALTEKAKRTVVRVSALFGAALSLGISPAPVAMPELDTSTELRKTNAEFARVVVNTFRADNDQFACLNLMPYRVGEAGSCSEKTAMLWQKDENLLFTGIRVRTRFVFDAQMRDRDNDFLRDRFFDTYQLWLTAHEFGHYLQLREKRFIYAPGYADLPEERKAQIRRAGELDADLFGLAVVSAYHPERMDGFDNALINYRLRRNDVDHGHSQLSYIRYNYQPFRGDRSDLADLQAHARTLRGPQ